MKQSKNITSSLFAAAVLSAGINTAQASGHVNQILNIRNATIDSIEETCSTVTFKNECYVSELQTLFANLTKDDKAVYAPSDEELIQHKRDIEERLSQHCSTSWECDLTRTQILLYTDISPDGQKLSIWLREGTREETTEEKKNHYHFIGASKISSGVPDVRRQIPADKTKFATGTGVYTTNPVVTGIIGYRAEGTKNKNGIRGFWEKGNRIFDVGPMKTKRAWDGSDMQIHFMVHSTDPVLESKFWTRASQGCVRIPKTINRFLEYSGALDAGYDTIIKNKMGSVRTNAMGLLWRNPRFSSVAWSLLIIGNGDNVPPMKLTSKDSDKKL